MKDITAWPQRKTQDCTDLSIMLSFRYEATLQRLK